MPTSPMPIVFGCQSLTLTPDERAFFRDIQPTGLILFRRNIDNATQVRALCDDFMALVPGAIITVDQEGGRIRRLDPPMAPEIPAAATYLKELPMDDALKAIRADAYATAMAVKALGLNALCTPVCDLTIPGAHSVIGDRSYSDDPDLVARCAVACLQGLHDAGIMGMIKHIPGHGRARADSHLELPIVTEPADTLAATDFRAFRQTLALIEQHQLPMPWAMTAHIIYKAIDPDHPATQSRRVIDQVIRHDIGFGGKIITDCLTMAALHGTMTQRAQAALAAGCDILLHCNGDMKQMEEIVAEI